ncbi:hypothetical protein [Halorarius litoreus]|uniref:hypothetical protein n=1 Tax=Halorarius litoreus TaxID=2962676 RepID=UPI0020CC0E68|nr:hypothetical protein [Halorarius litoreus]
MPSRRAALRAGGLAATTALAGCSRLPFVTGPKLTLNVFNFTDERRFISVELLRAAGIERSESVVYDRQFDVPPHDSEDSGRRRDEDAVESRKYVVRAGYDDGPTREFTYFPDCAETGDHPDEELYVELHSRGDGGPPYIDFQQNLCGRDTLQY